MKRSTRKVELGNLEAIVVGTMLLLSAHFGGGTLADWLTGGSIFLTFLCTQSAFDMADLQEKDLIGAEVQRRYCRLYICKEAFWIASCLALGSAPLIVSTVIFGAYPFWRRGIAKFRAGKISSESKADPRKLGIELAFEVGRTPRGMKSRVGMVAPSGE